MSALKYFKMYRLVEPEKGVFLKMMTVLFTQFFIVNAFFSISGELDFIFILALISIGSVYIYAHSLQINKSNILMSFPMTQRRRFFYDLLAVFYYYVIVLAGFMVYILLLMLVLFIISITTNANLLADFTFSLGDVPSLIKGFSSYYGALYAVLYMVMFLFSLQPLKYVTDTKIWYLMYTCILVVLGLFNSFISSLIEGKLMFNTSIIENLDGSVNSLLIIAITVVFIGTVIASSIKIGLKLAKYN